MRLKMPMQDFITLMEGHSGKRAVNTKNIRRKYGLSRDEVYVIRERIREKEAKVVLV